MSIFRNLINRDCPCRKKEEFVIEAWDGINGDSIVSLEVDESRIAIQCGTTCFFIEIDYCPYCGRKFKKPLP